VGKGHPCCNYHTCFCKIAYSLKMNQGRDVSIREWICIGDYVALKDVSPLWLISLETPKVKTKCVEDIWLM